MTAKVIRCTCKHEFQDRAYGEGMRIHNFAPKAGGQGMWRCTVCKNEKAKQYRALKNEKANE